MKHVLLSLVLLAILLVSAESGKKKNKEKEAEVEIIELENEEVEGKKKKGKGKNKDKNKDKGKDKKKCKGKGKNKVCEEDVVEGSAGLSGKEEKSCRKDEKSLVSCIADGSYILNLEEYSFKEELIEELHKSKEYKNMIEEAVDVMADGIVSDYLASDEFEKHIEGVIEEFNKTAEAQETIKKAVDDAVAEETKLLKAKLDEEVNVIKETEVEVFDLLEQFVLKLYDLSIEDRGIYRSNIEYDFLHNVDLFTSVLPDTTTPPWENPAEPFPFDPETDWEQWDDESYVLEIDHDVTTYYQSFLDPSEDDGFFLGGGGSIDTRNPFDWGEPYEYGYDGYNYNEAVTGRNVYNVNEPDSDDYYANWDYERQYTPIPEGEAYHRNIAPKIQDSPSNSNIYNYNYNGNDNYAPGPGPIMPMAPIMPMDNPADYGLMPMAGPVNPMYGPVNPMAGPVNPMYGPMYGPNNNIYEPTEPFERRRMLDSPSNNDGYDFWNDYEPDIWYDYEPIQKKDAPRYNSPGNTDEYDFWNDYEPIQIKDAPMYDSPGNTDGYDFWNDYEPIQIKDAPRYDSPGNGYYNDPEDDNDEVQIEKVTDEEQEQDPHVNVKQEDSGGSRKPPNSGKKGLKNFAGASGEKGGLIDDLFKKVDIGPKEEVKENDFAKKANNQKQLLNVKNAAANPANPKSEDVKDEPEQKKLESKFFNNLIKENAEKVMPAKKKSGNNAIVFG